MMSRLDAVPSGEEIFVGAKLLRSSFADQESNKSLGGRDSGGRSGVKGPGGRDAAAKRNED
jgi:hypothetical protein